MLIAEEIIIKLKSWFSAHSPSVRIFDLRNMLPSRPLVERGQRGYYKIDIAERRGICLHHSASWGSFKGMAEYHLDQWDSAAGIAYPEGIDRRGDLSLFWDLDVRTYAQGWKDDSDNPETIGDENIDYIPVLVAGNFSSPSNHGDGVGEPTLAQIKTVTTLISFFEHIGMPDTVGHFELGKPACPGIILEGIIRAAQSNIYLPRLPSKFSLSTVRGRQESLCLGAFYNSPLKVDGIWGDGSKSALRNFQKSVGLSITGIWNKQTERALTHAVTDWLSAGRA